MLCSCKLIMLIEILYSFIVISQRKDFFFSLFQRKPKDLHTAQQQDTFRIEWFFFYWNSNFFLLFFFRSSFLSNNPKLQNDILENERVFITNEKYENASIENLKLMAIMEIKCHNIDLAVKLHVFLIFLIFKLELNSHLKTEDILHHYRTKNE